MSLMFLAPFVASSGGAKLVTTPDLPWSPAWTHDTVASGVTAYAVLEWDATSGQLQYNGLGSGPSTSGDAGLWLLAGAAADYYLDITITGGSPGTLNYINDMSGGRQQMNVDRHVGVTETTTGQTHTCTFDIEIYNVPAGGTPLHTQSFTLSAQKDTP